MQHFILSVFGKDKPGIVAGVTKELYQLGLNIEDSSMTRLGGEFAIMLLLSSSKNILASEILKALEDVQKKFALSVFCKPISEEESYAESQRPFSYRITVFGYDRIGIVYHVSDLLAGYEVNIYDLRTQKSGELYVMFIECESDRDVYKDIKEGLDRLKEYLKVDVSVEPQEVTQL